MICDKTVRGDNKKQTHKGISYPNALAATKYRTAKKKRTKNSHPSNIDTSFLDFLMVDQPFINWCNFFKGPSIENLTRGMKINIREEIISAKKNKEIVKSKL